MSLFEDFVTLNRTSKAVHVFVQKQQFLFKATLLNFAVIYLFKG